MQINQRMQNNSDNRTLHLPHKVIEEIRKFQEEMKRNYNYHCHVYVKERGLTVSVPKTSLRVLWEHICDIAHENHSISLNGNRHFRGRMYVTYRQIFAVIARNKGYSFQSIGRTISKDHATIMHSVRLFKSLKSVNDPELMPIYNEVVEQLRIRINAADIELSDTSKNPNEPSALLVSYK